MFTSYRPINSVVPTPQGHLAKFGYLKSIPKTSKPFSVINAKAETVAVLPFFKSAFLGTRCLVTAEFWYEFAKVEVDGETIKQPYAFKVTDQKTFAFAGIYSKLSDAEGKEIYYFAIITCKPNKKSARVHPRMPVVLHHEDIKVWLYKDSSFKDLMHGLRSYEDESTDVSKVLRLVNCNYKDGPELIKPI